MKPVRTPDCTRMRRGGLVLILTACSSSERINPTPEESCLRGSERGVWAEATLRGVSLALALMENCSSHRVLYKKKKKKTRTVCALCASASSNTTPTLWRQTDRGARAHRHVIRAGTRLQFVYLFNYFIYFPCVLLAWQIKCICIAKRKCGVKTGEI